MSRLQAVPLLALLGCARIPTALQPAPPPASSAAAPARPHDIAEAARVLAGRDPLVRRPPPLDLSAMPAGRARDAAEAALATISSGHTTPADLHGLERAWAGSLAVPLARGGALAEVESRTAGGLRREDQGQLLALLAPVADTDRTGPGDVREPLAWLGERERLHPDLLASMERRVLLGWLSSPALPQASLADAFTTGVHDRLVDSAAGALLLARARDQRTDPATLAGAIDDLAVATTLALQQAGADRDSQQRALREALEADRSAQLAMGRSLDDAHDAPLHARLAAARLGLVAGAGDDRATGLALVALTAERIVGSGTCGGAPCRGLDRAQTLAVAASWHDEVGAYGLAWRCVAAKRAVDTLEVTRDQPTWGVGVDLLVDVLLAEGDGPVDASLLRQARPAPETWLALTRAAGAPDATDAARGIAAVGALTARVCADAAEAGLPPAAADQARTIAERLQAEPG